MSKLFPIYNFYLKGFLVQVQNRKNYFIFNMGETWLSNGQKIRMDNYSRPSTPPNNAKYMIIWKPRPLALRPVWYLGNVALRAGSIVGVGVFDFLFIPDTIMESSLSSGWKHCLFVPGSDASWSLNWLRFAHWSQCTPHTRFNSRSFYSYRITEMSRFYHCHIACIKHFQSGYCLVFDQ